MEANVNNVNWVEKFMNRAKKTGATVRINKKNGTIETYTKTVNKWFSWIFLKNAEREYHHYFIEMEKRTF